MSAKQNRVCQTQSGMVLLTQPQRTGFDAKRYFIASTLMIPDLKLTDERKLSVPLSWIPTLHNAPPEEPENYEISKDRKMVIWDPDKCSIKDEVKLEDYPVPGHVTNGKEWK